MASHRASLTKIMVIIANVDLRMTTTQYFSRRSWADTQNVLGFDLAKNLLNDEKADIIVTDAGYQSVNGPEEFIKQVRGTRRNAQSLIVYLGESPLASSAREMTHDSRITLSPHPLSEDLYKHITPHLELAKGSASPQPQQAQTSLSSAFDIRLLNSVLEAVKDVINFYFRDKLLEFGKPNFRKEPLLVRSGITGLITIDGDKFRGSLAIAASLDFLTLLSHKIYPDQDIKLTKDGSMDLIAELSNQLVGRIKARFGTLGLNSQIGLPIVQIGKNHAVPHKVICPAIFLGLKVAGSICEIELAMLKEEGFRIDESKGAESAKGILLFD